MQLRPSPGKERSRYIKGEDYPVCRAVLANLNKFCDEPPQYSRRKLHPSSRNLEEPAWRPLDPAQNVDIVQAIYTTTVGGSAEEQAHAWRNVRGRLTSLTTSGVLRLWEAEIDIDANGATETVYLLENRYPHDPPKHNAPVFMVARQGQRTQADFATEMGTEVYGDLWKSANEYGTPRWHSITFHPVQAWFLIQEIVNFGDMGGVTRCTIQHINDYRRK